MNTLPYKVNDNKSKNEIQKNLKFIKYFNLSIIIIV